MHGLQPLFVLLHAKLIVLILLPFQFTLIFAQLRSKILAQSFLDNGKVWLFTSEEATTQLLQSSLKCHSKLNF
jgi:hypothetical protein